MDERQYITIFTHITQNDFIPAIDNNIRKSEDGTFIMCKHSNIIPKSKQKSILNHTDRFTRLKNLQVSNADQIEKAEKSAARPELGDAAFGTTAVIIFHEDAIWPVSAAGE